jgi:hypothetical protein
MAQYGRYNPENSENTSTLFVFQEAPLTSAKVNRWNGNIAAAFDLLHRACASLFARNNSAVITTQGEDSLKVDPAESPNMTVKVNPGLAVMQESFAGTMVEQVLPAGGVFTAPVEHPRIDLIVLTDAGELDVVQGVEADTPIAPETSSGLLVLAQIFQRVGAVSIVAEDDSSQSYIINVRPRVLLGEAHLHGADAAPDQAPDGERTQFFTGHIYRAGSLDIFLNGVLQLQGVDYQEDELRNGYTFTQSPLAHYRIQHRYIVDYEVE